MDDGLDDLSQEEQSAIRDVIERVDVDRIVEATGVSRRQALQVIAATGVGIAVSGIGTNALVGNAQAAASTSDSDGNVGLPSNRVDVFADGVDCKSLNTDQTSAEVDTDQDNIPLSISEVGDRRYDAVKMDTEEAPFTIWRNTSDFNGRTDPRMGWGYNLDTRARGQENTEKPAGGWTIEGEYLNADGILNQEYHLQGVYDDGTSWRSETTYVEQPSTGDPFIIKEHAVSEFKVQDRSRTPQFSIFPNSDVVQIRQGNVLSFAEEGSRIKMTDPNGSLEGVMGHSQGRFKLAHNNVTTQLRGQEVWLNGPIDFSVTGPSATSPQLKFSSGATKNADHTTAADDIVLVDIGGTTYEIPARTH